MTAPFVPHNVAQRWLYSVLSGSAAVVAAVGLANIYPNVSPSADQVRQLAYSYAGPLRGPLATPMRAPIAQVAMLWDITAWEPRFSQQALDPLMEAVMTVLIGADTRGKTHRFVDGARLWGIDCDYVGPEYVPLDLDPAGVWAPVRERYSVMLRPSG